MALFSLLGSTMGFSVETLGFYALFLPLMAASGYDRMVTAAMIIVGALVGVMSATVNPFSIGVAAGEAQVSIGDGIVLRMLLWLLLTGIAMAYVLRYAAKIRRDPAASLVGFDEPEDDAAGVTRWSGTRWSGRRRSGRVADPDAEVGPRDHRAGVRPDDLLGDPVVEHLRRRRRSG